MFWNFAFEIICMKRNMWVNLKAVIPCLITDNRKKCLLTSSTLCIFAYYYYILFLRQRIFIYFQTQVFPWLHLLSSFSLILKCPKCFTLKLSVKPCWLALVFVLLPLLIKVPEVSYISFVFVCSLSHKYYYHVSLLEVTERYALIQQRKSIYPFPV